MKPNNHLPTRITIAKGDGIGPEIMDATLRIMKAAGAQIQYHEIEIGERVYLAGYSSGISKADWDIIRENKILLKAPITTPQGGGYKSLNVTLRKTLGLYANVRPCSSLSPYVETKHPNMDVVIVRENEEDLYAGIEHQQTDEVVQCLKLISRPGCEKIVRYAFEYAKHHNRKKVTCFTKDNIMKQTDGLFRKVFNEIAVEYPNIATEHWIIDIGAAKLSTAPEQFDVIVMPNLYGDILSDIAAEITGSVGLGGSANIGPTCAMFEAIHGSAPDIADKNIANPSGLLQAAIQLLQHIGQHSVATTIQNAWLYTIERGIHTKDIFIQGKSAQCVGTQEFADAIIQNLGKVPNKLKSAQSTVDIAFEIPPYVRKSAGKKELVGVDIFVHWSGSNPAELGHRMEAIATNNLSLNMITNRGVKVYPDGYPETFCTDHWRCRFMSTGSSQVSSRDLIHLMEQCIEAQIDVIKTENLYEFDGKKAFSLGQGQ